MRNLIGIFLFGGLMLCRAVCGQPADLVGPPSFSLSYEGVSSSDLNLSSVSEEQIDVLASGSSAWGLVHALWLPESHQESVLTWESDWTIDVDVRNSVTVTNGGTFIDNDGDTEYVNQAQMWVALHAQNPYVSSTSWYDEAFLEFGFYNNNGQIKGIKSENELTDAEAYQALSINTAVKMRAAYSASNQLIEVSYSLDGADYTSLQTVDVSSLQSQGLYIALGAESDNVAISAGQNYFKGFTVTGVPSWELYDDFSGSTLDTQKWETSYWPGGLVPVIDGGQLRLENGGGVGRKDAAFMSTLQSAGFDFSSGTYHSNVVLTDPSIIGIEVELFLPAGVAADSGVFIDLFEQVGPQEIRAAGIELGYWGETQAELWFNKSAYSSGTKISEVDVTEFVSLGQSYRVRILRQNGVIKLYWDDVLIQTHAAEGELLAVFIAAFNDAGQAMYATVDNVRVLRNTASEPPLPVVESSGNTDLLEDDSGYYAGNADTPLLFSGRRVSRSYPGAGFTALGVDLVNGAYRVVLYNGSQYYAANFSLNGSNSSTWAVVANVRAEEVNLQQDLDSDGYVGIAPPASLAGKAYQFSIGGDDALSVPLELVFGSATYNEGFAGSLLDPNQSYTYANGVVTTDGGDELRLTFTSATAGSFECWELDYGEFYLEDVGTFNEVTPSLVLKNDWQRTETMYSPLSTNYWNVWRRSVDSVANNAGELNFLFAGGGEDDYPEIDIEYGRTLPLDENWQVVLNDAYGNSSLDDFEFELELGFDGQGYEFECELEFEGSIFDGMRIDAFYSMIQGDITVGAGPIDPITGLPPGSGIIPLDHALEDVATYRSGYASVSTVEDPRIQANVSLRITHNANSRELRFEYQPGDASTWEELARLNLETGAFESIYNSYGEGFSGQLFSSSERLSLEIEVESNQMTQLGDLKIGGIEIGSYTPPPPPASPESLVNYKLVGQFTEGTNTYRHDFFFTGSTTVQSHYFVESNDPSDVDVWTEETYEYTKTGTTTGTIAITNSTGETADVYLDFGSATTGTAIANGLNGNPPNSASGPFTFVQYDSSELPEPPLPVVESSGNTDLLEDDSGYYAGNADTPLLYSGRRVSRSYPGAGFTALGVDLVNGAYRVVLYNGNQYYAANFALNGSNSSTWALVSNLLLEEVKLQQDLDSDGYVGIAPPASLAGKAYQFSIGGDDALSVPLELVFGSATYNEGFAGSLLDPNQSYTYANGVVTTDDGDEIRLTFTSATSGSFEYWEYDEDGFYLEDVGTFNLVTPSLVLKNDWQRTETIDSALSTNYWNIWRRTVDSLAYDDGELNFLFAGGGEDDYPEIDIEYGRTLPMDENWQVVLNDAYGNSSLDDFEFELELGFDGQGYEFECELEFEGSIFDGMSVSASFNSMTQGIDINGDGVIQTYSYAEDLDGDGFVDSGNEYDYDGDGNLDVAEDLDFDGFLDVAEDLNGDNILNNGGTGAPLVAGGPNTLLPVEGALINEDINNNGVLDAGEDLNGNGILETALNEDIDGDGQLDAFNEDVDGDGRLDWTNEDLDGDGRLDIWDETNINENVTAYGYGYANVSVLEDPRIQANVSLRITHNANSRELRFEYQPGDANGWSELARLNLETGAFESIYNSYGEGFSGQSLNPTERLSLEIEAESNQMTQLGDLKIGGIEIGSYTPPPPPASPESLVNYKLVGQFTEGTDIYRHDFFFTGSGTLQSHYFVESSDPSDVDVWSEETYSYDKTGPITGTIAITSSTGETVDVYLEFGSATTGTAIANGLNGNPPNSASGLFTFVQYDSSELPEPPLPVVESSGNTDLLEDESGYYAGSADTPLLFSGRRVSRSYPGAGFTALGVDLVNGAYRVVLYNGSQYYAANFALNGSNSSTWAVVANVRAEEVNLQQDLDNDGHVGTPPPASIVGMQFEYTSADNVTSLPIQELYGSDGLADYGFSNSIIGRSLYTYSDGVISFPQWNEEIRLTFTSANSGTYAYFELYGEEGGLDDSGTFTVVTPSLEEKTDWQRTETFDSALSNDYWNIFHGLEDGVEVANGALNFIFAGSDEEGEEDEDDEYEDYEDYEIEMDYGRTLPMDESWQIVMNDVYGSSSLEDFEFDLELGFEGEVYDFWFGFDFEESISGVNQIDVDFYSSTTQGIDINGDGMIQTAPYAADLDSDGFVDLGNEDLNGNGVFDLGEDLDNDGNFDIWDERNIYENVDGLSSGYASVSTVEDPRIQSNVSLRITHNANSRELVFEYQPGDANGWLELARLNLESGDFSGLNSYADQGNGELISTSQRMELYLEVEAEETTQVGDIRIGGIEIGSYTPPPTPVDSDGDGLDDSVETNTGVYVSPSDTGTDPNKADSSGDGFTDGEVVSAGLSPVVDYSSLLAIVRNNPERFELEDTNSTVDMKLRGLRLERAGNGAFNMNFDLEMSTDLQTWTPHTSHSIELSVPDQSKAFMRLKVK